MSKIMQHDQGVVTFTRRGERLYSGDLPAELQPGAFKNNPMYITDVTVSDFDITGKVVCLNDKRVLYEFGKGFGSVTVSGEILLGLKDFGKKKGKVKPIIQWFNEKRVSKQTKPLTISAGQDFGGVIKFYLTAFTCGQWEARTGTCRFQLSGDLVSYIP